MYRTPTLVRIVKMLTASSDIDLIQLRLDQLDEGGVSRRTIYNILDRLQDAGHIRWFPAQAGKPQCGYRYVELLNKEALAAIAAEED